jgi:hypothetical protein
MKIDGVEPITNSQHRLTAEHAKKQGSAEHALTQEGKQMEKSALRQAPAAQESSKSQAQSQHQQASQHAPAAGDKAALQAMAHSFREEFAEAGLTPPPSRFAGVTLVSTAQLAQAARGSESLSTQMGPMHQAKMAMVRQLLRRLSGKELSVMTPRELGKAQAWLEAQSREGGAELAETPSTDQGPLGSDRWRGQGVLRTGDGKDLAIAAEARVRDPQATVSEPPADRPDPLTLQLDASSKDIEQSRFEFSVELAGADDASNDSLQVSDVAVDTPVVLAVGARDSGAVYVGHLMGPDAVTPTPTTPPARQEPDPDTIDHLDLSI